MTTDEITYLIRGACFEVLNELGPGLFESVYETALEIEIRKRGLKVEKQVALPVTYKNIKTDQGFRVDLVVEEKVIIEIKSVEFLHDVYKKQLLTYLKLSGLKLGYLINFNSLKLVDKQSIIRMIN